MLTCPSSTGAICDETLCDVIDQYVEHELAAADLEGRNSQVQRYPQSRLEWNEGEDGSEYSVDLRAPPAPAGKPVAVHIIAVSKNWTGRLKFFTMTQLPEGFMQRALSANTPKAQKIFSYGVTCRTVAWKPGEGWVFNGRDGADSFYRDSNCNQIDLTEFPTLNDTRDQATLDILGAEEEEATPTRWEHVGPAPDVKMWLQGVGQTRQVPSEEVAELPKATRLLLAGDEMRGTGRARVPKGYQLGTAEEDDSSDDDRKISLTKPSFAATMLSGPSGKAPVGRDSSGSDSETSSDSDFTANAAPSFAALIGKAQDKAPERMSGWAATAKQSPVPLSPASPSTVRNASEAPIVQYPGGIPVYTKKYAKVDKVGLTAHPELTATYAMENYTPQRAQPKILPVMPRKKPCVESGTNVQGTATSIRSETATQNSRSASWEQKLTTSTNSQAGLIDIASRLSTRPTAVPPGFADSSPRYRQPKQTYAQQSESHKLIDAAHTNLVDGSPPRPLTNTMPPSGQTLQPRPPKVRQSVNGDLPVDKLATFPQDFNGKRNTMNLKMGKNVKSKGKTLTQSSAKKTNVELPMPDPLPAPRARKVVEAQKPFIKVQRIPKPDPEAEDYGPDSDNEFTTLMIQVMEEQYMSDEDEQIAAGKTYKLIVQIGQILSLSGDMSFSRYEASPPGVFQTLMNSSTIDAHFFPGLTTSMADASFMVDLLNVDKTPKLVYEILVKDSAGWLLTCTIPANKKAQLTIKTGDQAAGEFILYD